MTNSETTINFVEDGIRRALSGHSQLSPEILSIRGFATATQRHLVNNLCRPLASTYLEVGMFAGATSIAAMYGNPHLEFFGIDNFSQEFGTPGIEEEFDDNFAKYVNPAQPVNTWKADCFEFARSPEINWSMVPIDFYYYDGNHSQEDQARALPAFFDFMADRFIFMVDDTNWPFVAEGTRQGFEELKERIKIERSWHLSGALAENDPIWHNGVDLFVISKVYDNS